MDLVTSPPTEAPTATSTAPYGRSTTSISTSSAITAFPGSDSYPVFPNGKYLSKFYLVSGQYSGLNDLDYHLYNVCYLPYRPFDVGTSFDIDKRRVSHTDSNAPRPTYLINDPPCKRQAAINANCHFKNTNGTFSGLEPYTNDFDVQQQCYCEKYPFFDSALGCMKCFETHGGIEGYHWFPKSYVDAASKAYCGQVPAPAEFFDFIKEWAKTDPAATLQSTTASTILGTQTDASLYYTYAAASTTNPNSAVPAKSLGLRKMLLAALAVGVALYR
ncbi:hypothetical protein GTR04_1844 [Trichophyton interdigitale]|nr:hypothetical protein GY631_5913 [Trichophyton interdigitale]KAG5218160.1 hypothetical protein GY632_5838 [Trichophyton interdigitale]KAG8210800.1 hypothetical protein GTR04_1844 [Trichophyton interdigitale]